MFKIMYYEPITSCITLDNPHIIPMLLQMRWYGSPASSKLWLKIIHPISLARRADITDTCFHKVLWDDISDSEGQPFRKARLRLEGKRDNNPSAKEDIFALLEIDLDRPRHGISIIFSPVPFGPDGKPKLPNTPGLIQAISYLLAPDSPNEWTVYDLIGVLRRETKQIQNVNIGDLLFELGKIGIARQHGNTIYFEMSFDRFINIFGIKLPKTDALQSLNPPRKWTDPLHPGP